MCRAAREGADGGSAVDWSELPLGGLVAGAVHDVREYGVLCDLAGHPDVVALVSPGQARTRTSRLAELLSFTGVVFRYVTGELECAQVWHIVESGRPSQRGCPCSPGRAPARRSSGCNSVHVHLPSITDIYFVFVFML